jgi:hypothetical protein
MIVSKEEVMKSICEFFLINKNTRLLDSVMNDSANWWFDELKNDGQASLSGSSWSHFSLMSWYSVQHLGCSVKHCTGMGFRFLYILLAVADEENKLLVYCDYWPPGNILGSHMYVEGEPCSKCPEKFPKCDPDVGLCYNPDVPEIHE